MDRRPLFWGLLVVMLAADQATKAAVRGDLEWLGIHGLVPGQYRLWPIPRVFEITLTYNQGIAFGMLQGLGLVMAPVALGIAATMMVYAHRHPFEWRIKHVAAALLAAGALGNLYDRVFHGKVTDMFLLRLGHITRDWPFRLNDFPVFNVADACITAAAALLLAIWVKEARQEAAADPSDSAAAAERTESG